MRVCGVCVCVRACVRECVCVCLVCVSSVRARAQAHVRKTVTHEPPTQPKQTVASGLIITDAIKALLYNTERKPASIL